MTMITEDYVSFETAKLLKEKGFDEKCTHYYKNEKYLVDLGYTNIRSYTNSDLVEEFVAPTLQMAMKWLREVHNIHIGINPISGKGYNATIYDVGDFDDYGIISDTEFFFHVEEACEAAIKCCLENLI